jgi:hypothetical protein
VRYRDDHRPGAATGVGLAALTVLVAACGTPRYRPANPRDPDRTVTCTGTLLELHAEPGEALVLVVDPRPEDAVLLGPGQTTVVCELPANEPRAAFAPILSRLAVGQPTRSPATTRSTPRDLASF